MAISITEDQIFIKSLYGYRLFSNIGKNEKEDESIHRDARNKTITFFIAMINRCIERLHDKDEAGIENAFLKYLYWKQAIIEQNFNIYASDLQHITDWTESEQELLQKLKETHDRYEKMKTEYLRLSAVEEGKVEEYLRAYSILLQAKPVSNKKVFVENVACRFADYLKTITEKRCLTNFGRRNCNEQVLQDEANYILNKLNENGCVACKNVTEKAWNAFCSFRKGDDDNRRIQEHEIIVSLEIAHKRANETRLERFARQLREAISAIERRLTNGLRHAFQLSTIVVGPLLHPIETLKNLKYAIMHPIESVKAVGAWVKDNPWKAAVIAIGSVIIGASVGIGVGGPLIAAAFAVDLGIGLLSGFIASTVSISFSMAAIAGGGGSLVHKAEYYKELKRKEFNAQVKQVEDEVTPLQRQQENEDHIRDRLLETRANVEKEFELIDQLQDEVRALREKQLNALDDSSLQSTLGEMKDTQTNIEAEIQNVSLSRRTAEKQLFDIHADHAVINIAQDASRRVQQRSSTFLTSFINNEGLSSADGM